MLLSNLESVPGHQILKQLDVVYGSTVRSKHVGRDLMASLKNIVGGELTGYTELLEESRQEAMQRMIVKPSNLVPMQLWVFVFLPQILPKVLLSYSYMAQQWLCSLKHLICPIHLMHR